MKPNNSERPQDVLNTIENTVLTYPEAFEKYIANNKVVGRYWDMPVFGDDNKPYYTYVEGIKFENGYVWASHGGGCSGEDCNQTFIISPDNKFVAGFDW